MPLQGITPSMAGSQVQVHACNPVTWEVKAEGLEIQIHPACGYWRFYGRAREGREERKEGRESGKEEGEVGGRKRGREGRSKLNTCLSGFGQVSLEPEGISEGVCLCNRVKDRQSPVRASQRAGSGAVRSLLRLSSC